MSEISSTTRKVFTFLQNHWQRHGVSPSSREIQEALHFRSQTAAMNHLRKLISLGWIRPIAGRGRTRGWIPQPTAIAEPAPVGQPSGSRYLLPLLGSIAAGLPESNADQSEELLAIDLDGLSLPRGGRYFGLRVRGDSMIGAHIMPGDIVVMEFRPPRHRDIVAALIDGETTLKRLLMQKGQPFLQAENPAYPSLIPARELVIQGVLVALLRQY